MSYGSRKRSYDQGGIWPPSPAYNVEPVTNTSSSSCANNGRRTPRWVLGAAVRRGFVFHTSPLLRWQHCRPVCSEARYGGCVVLFTGWFHRCIALMCALMHRTFNRSSSSFLASNSRLRSAIPMKGIKQHQGEWYNVTFVLIWAACPSVDNNISLVNFSFQQRNFVALKNLILIYLLYIGISYNW